MGIEGTCLYLDQKCHVISVNYEEIGSQRLWPQLIQPMIFNMPRLGSLRCRTSPSSGQATISFQLRRHKLPACHSRAALGRTSTFNRYRRHYDRRQEFG